MHKLLIIFFLLFCSILIFARQSSANEISSNATSQVNLTNNGSGEGDPNITVKEGITLLNDSQNSIVKGYGSDGIEDADIIIESGAKIQGKDNVIMIRMSDNVTITNSGSIISVRSKAINMASAQNTTINNNVGATITSLNNVISGEEINADSEFVENTSINNSGTMYSDTARVINLFSGVPTVP